MNASHAIVCGFDLSAASDDAAAVAAGLARAFGDVVVLVHATGADLSAASDLGGVIRRAIDDEQAGLRLHGVEVDRVVERRPPVELLLEQAAERDAHLLVIGAGGGPQSSGRRAYSGRVARDIVRHAKSAVLVLHDCAVLERWMAHRTTLRVFAGVAFDDALPALRAWLVQLRRIGPVDVVIGHVSFPPEEARRLGGPPPAHFIENDPAVQTLVRSELATIFNDLPGEGSVEVRVTAGLGKTDGHLWNAAAEARADLVVLGAHQRSGLARLLHGSSEQGLLRLASTNLLVVPVR